MKVDLGQIRPLINTPVSHEYDFLLKAITYFTVNQNCLAERWGNCSG